MKYNLEKIKQEFNTSEQRLKFLYFWGHTPNKNGVITKSCFSQWWQRPFKVEDTIYNTAEHWMMASKARLFNDIEILAKILVSKHPMEAKTLGRKVKGFDPLLWNKNKYNIVKNGNSHKFSQHEDLKQFLVQTENRILVEASPLDSVWGIGMDQHNENAYNPNYWKGENLLGFALMEVRDMLKNII